MNDDRAWYRRVRRWGQTNLTETDPKDYDSDFWRAHWERTRVQGIIVNAGGIVAYYPTGFELQYRAAHLGDRDLFGEVVADARRAGLAVLARMDSNRADARFHAKHPDWFCVDRAGKPFTAGDRYVACVNSPYYSDYIPDILREIVTRYSPDGFTDNSWAGADRQTICYCAHCRSSFHASTGLGLPGKPDWEDDAYRRWIRWSFDCRIANWDLNNRVTREAGGPACLWLGMCNANPVGTSGKLVDVAAVGERSEIIMCDHQGRDAMNGFEQNSLNGMLLHGVLGWDKQVPESMAMYLRGERAFRKATSPPAEARTWMVSGFAGGISPWWHHIGAGHEDRRQMATAEPVMRWHEANEANLYDREPVANVGLVWSQINTEFYGRADRRERVALPWRGFTRAMTRARIPYLPVHADHIDRDASRFDVLVLPDLAAVSDGQVDAVRRFVARGGHLVVTGRTSLLDAWGEPRADFALTDLTGVHATGERHGPETTQSGSWDREEAHNYLRLEGREGARHPIVGRFADTNILPFGGCVEGIRIGNGARVLATYIPPFPIYPPEFSWMRTPETNIPAIAVRETAGGSRVVTLASDIDRCYGRQHLPDHGDLLEAAVRWAAGDTIPLVVDGPGYLSCTLYRQPGRLILHIVNLTGCTAWPTYVEEHIAVGPLRIGIRTDAAAISSETGRSCVAERDVDVKMADGWARFELPEVGIHEMVVLGE